MKRTILVFAALLTISVPAFGQTTVGFSDPDNIQPLLDYRLPEWGYDNLFLDFSVNGFRTTNYTDNTSSASSTLSGQLSPVYDRFRESEERSSLLRINSLFDYSGESEEEGKNREFEVRLMWTTMERIYQENSDMFFSGELSGNFFQNKTRDEFTSPAVDEHFLDRSFSTTLSLGVGYGRLRNVNPMIRSLRLNERLNAVDANQTLGLTDLLAASEQFTRRNGYRQNYDRPQKYFWNDMDQLISPDLSALNPFDLLYLTDTSSETIGQRLEGWEISGSAGLQYSANYRHEEDEITNETSSNLSQFTNLVPSVSGAWFKNLSLEHQVGIRSGFMYQIPLNRSMDFKFYSFNVAGSWLYNITDRILTNTSLVLSNLNGSSDTPSNTIITARSELNFFIENSLALFSTLSFNYRTNSSVAISNGSVISSTDSSQLQFNAGIRYYLLRGMF